MPRLIISLNAITPGQIISPVSVSIDDGATDEFIVKRTGVSERRHAEANVSASDLAVKACHAAIEDAGIDLKNINLLIMNTITPDHADPG